MTPRQPHRPTAAAELGTQTGMNRDMEVLERLKDVSCAAQGVFLETLTELSRLVKNLPLQLPADQGYLLELKQGTLHIWGKQSGIVNFELAGTDVRVTRVMHTAEGLRLELQGEQGSAGVVLHREAHSATVRSAADSYVTRRSTPWREPAGSSESCRGGRGGEG